MIEKLPAVPRGLPERPAPRSEQIEPRPAIRRPGRRRRRRRHTVHNRERSTWARIFDRGDWLASVPRSLAPATPASAKGAPWRFSPRLKNRPRTPLTRMCATGPGMVVGASGGLWERDEGQVARLLGQLHARFPLDD